MPYINEEKRKEYHKRWNRQYYIKNKAKERKRIERRKLEIKIWFKDYKKTLRCKFCEESNPVCLDFHHKDWEDKKLMLSTLCAGGYSKKRLLKEIKKCIIVCANCHRKIHAMRGDIGIKNSKLFKKGRYNCLKRSPVV